MLEPLIIAFTECQKELVQVLVDGVDDYSAYREVKGKINGLEIAKQIAQKQFEEQAINDGSTEDEDE